MKMVYMFLLKDKGDQTEKGKEPYDIKKTYPKHKVKERLKLKEKGYTFWPRNFTSDIYPRPIPATVHQGALFQGCSFCLYLTNTHVALTTFQSCF